jgi:branched-chain amino acid aminotransferase
MLKAYLRQEAMPATSQYAFFEGKIVPVAEAKISVMTHAFNYGTGVFGGLRAYWNDDAEQLYIFRPVDHFVRLIESASLMRIKVPYSTQELTQILVDLLRAEGFHSNCYIRPLAYKSSEGIGVRLHDVSDGFTMFALTFGRYIEKEEGAHACFSAWNRIDDNTIPARGKITGAYANSALIKSDAVLSGYDEALVLNADGHVSEASAANVFIVRKGQIITPPISSNILEGITRRTILQLLHDEMRMDVVEREIDRTEVYLADEVFLCGTGVQLAAVTRVEHRLIGSGQMGPITRQIRDLQNDVLYGRITKYHHWLTPVYADAPVKVT